MKDLLIVIPAYNEEASIEEVIADIKANCPQFDYIIVNDGSKDGTKQLCMDKGYNMLDLPVNIGLSGAFQAGMQYAFLNKYLAVLQFDGDAQHDAVYIEPMYNALLESNADIVVGSRSLTESKHKALRMIGSLIIRGLIKISTGKNISDPTSGMRIYNQEMIDLFANNINFSPEPDTLGYLMRCGYQIKEVKVKMKKRFAGESYLDFFQSAKYMVHMVFSLLLMQFARKKVVNKCR